MELSPDQFEQLPMFATARELRHEYESSEVGRSPGLKDDLYAEKAEEAWEYGLAQDIEEHGVKYPVNVEHSDRGKLLWNGHHRVAAQYDADPDAEIPLNHATSMFENEQPWYGRDWHN